MNNSILRKTFISILSIFSGLLVGSFIIILTGNNPVDLFIGIYDGSFDSMYNIGEWIVYATPLILTGLAVGFGLKSGLFNIGAEGQFIFGTISAVLVGQLFPGGDIPILIHATIAIVLGFIAGGLYGLIVGFLKAQYDVHEVVVSIMLNYIAFYLANELLNSMNGSTEVPINSTVVISAPWLQDIFSTFNGSSELIARMNYGIFIAIICVILYWFVLEKTTFGFELKAVGLNKKASRAAGVNIKSKIISTMFISGGLAGLAGTIYVIGSPEGIAASSSFRNFGFDGIAIALLGQLSAVGILLSSFLLSALRLGSTQMTSIPSEIVDIIIGVIILFSSIGLIFEDKIIKLFKGGNRNG